MLTCVNNGCVVIHVSLKHSSGYFACPNSTWTYFRFLMTWNLEVNFEYSSVLVLGINMVVFFLFKLWLLTYILPGYQSCGPDLTHGVIWFSPQISEPISDHSSMHCNGVWAGPGPIRPTHSTVGPIWCMYCVWYTLGLALCGGSGPVQVRQCQSQSASLVWWEAECHMHPVPALCAVCSVHGWSSLARYLHHVLTLGLTVPVVC